MFLEEEEWKVIMKYSGRMRSTGGQGRHCSLLPCEKKDLLGESRHFSYGKKGVTSAVNSI